MSEKKVQKNKEERRNRARTMRKNKMLKKVGMILGIIGILALVAWITWSIADLGARHTLDPKEMEGMEVADSDGNTYNIHIREDGTAELQMKESAANSTEEPVSVPELESTVSSIESDVDANIYTTDETAVTSSVVKGPDVLEIADVTDITSESGSLGSESSATGTNDTDHP